MALDHTPMATQVAAKSREAHKTGLAIQMVQLRVKTE